MVYTRETLKVYLSLTDEQLRTIGHGNVAKHREVAQAWVEGKVVQVLPPGGDKYQSKWIDLDAHIHSVGLSGDKYRIKPEPMVRVTINGKEYSYCPPKRGRRGYVVTRNILGNGRYGVYEERLYVEDADDMLMWDTLESAQQFADVLNAMLRAEAKE